MVVCCVCGESGASGSPISFHCFPRDEKRRRQWLLQFHAEDFEVDYYTKLCSKHFESECFDPEKVGRTRLKKDAIPTLFDFPLILHNRAREVNIKQKTQTEKKTQNGPSTEKETSKRQKYYLDFTEEDMNSPFKMKRFLLTVKQETVRHVRRINILIRKKKLLAKRVYSLKQVLRILKRWYLVSQTADSVLELASPGSGDDLIGRMRSGILGDKYPPELCAFAVVLQHYLDKHIKTCQKLLTLNSVIRQLLQNSTKLLMLLPDLKKKRKKCLQSVQRK